MRGLLAILFLTLALAGCLQNDTPSESDDEAPRGLDSSRIGALDGSQLGGLDGGFALYFNNTELPFSQTFAVPEGATMVRFVADPGDGSTISVSMRNEDTGRRRCNQQPVVGLGQALTGERSCSSLAAIDPPGTQWTAVASGPPTADVRIEFLDRPVDGIAAQLNLENLSHATYELEPTMYRTIPSFDSTPLWVEVTLPQGEGPWPTVIASSPYNGELETGRGLTPAMWTYWTQDWAKRGYAAVNVDVRGYGMSGGCVEVWGINEQKDQKFIVDWVATQDWSDGNVGFYGQSYVGTTPVAAAVQAPEALKAIIAVAPVINAYEDWHYGGVPNGESTGSPVAYQVLTAAPGIPGTDSRTDYEEWARHAADGVCDPTLLPDANDPRAIYSDYYRERDFKLRAGDVTAAVMFTEGFEDANVKSAMIPGWFNDITAPKLGIFGHWLHQHPPRMDAEVLFLGWMDQYVKGADIGFENVPNALITAENDMHRTADAWPPADVENLELGLDFSARQFGLGPGAGTFDLAMLGVPDPTNALPTTVVLEHTFDVAQPLVNPSLHVEGNLVGENGFVYARLDEHRADGSSRLLTWGMLNLALRNGYDTYEPANGQISGDLPFRPTEFIIGAGSRVTLAIQGVEAPVTGVAQPQPAQWTLDGAASYLALPDVPLDAYEPIPLTAIP